MRRSSEKVGGWLARLLCEGGGGAEAAAAAEEETEEEGFTTPLPLSASMAAEQASS